jgi:hypothetical protein
MNGDPTPANELIADRNPAMQIKHMEAIRQAMRTHQIVFGNPENGQGLGKIDPKRLIKEMTILKDLGMIEKVYELERLLDGADGN